MLVHEIIDRPDPRRRGMPRTVTPYGAIVVLVAELAREAGVKFTRDQADRILEDCRRLATHLIREDPHV